MMGVGRLNTSLVIGQMEWLTMNLTQAILKEIQDLPDDKQQEVLDFTRFIKYKLSAADALPRPSLFGSDQGKVHLTDNFDEPLADFAEYME